MASVVVLVEALLTVPHGKAMRQFGVMTCIDAAGLVVFSLSAKLEAIGIAAVREVAQVLALKARQIAVDAIDSWM